MFGDNLQAARKKLHLTQDELAVKVGLSRSALGMYERGQREPDFDTLTALADALDVSVNYLLTGQEKYSLDDLVGMRPDDIAEFLSSLGPGEFVSRSSENPITPTERRLLDAVQGMTDEQIGVLITFIDNMQMLKGE